MYAHLSNAYVCARIDEKQIILEPVLIHFSPLFRTSLFVVCAWITLCSVAALALSPISRFSMLRSRIGAAHPRVQGFGSFFFRCVAYAVLGLFCFNVNS